MRFLSVRLSEVRSVKPVIPLRAGFISAACAAGDGTLGCQVNRPDCICSAGGAVGHSAEVAARRSIRYKLIHAAGPAVVAVTPSMLNVALDVPVIWLSNTACCLAASISRRLPTQLLARLISRADDEFRQRDCQQDADQQHDDKNLTSVNARRCNNREECMG